MALGDRSTAAALLAAGAGTRFRGPGHKLTTSLRLQTDGPELPVVEWSLRAAEASGLAPLIVVTGAADIGSILERTCPGAVVVPNPDWGSGMRSSLLAALRTARDLGCGAVVVGLGDQPGLDPAAWRKVAESDAPIAIATYAGRRGHPVKIDVSFLDELAEPGGDPDSGARSLVSRHPDLVAEVPCSGDDRDIDTTEDIPRWKP